MSEAVENKQYCAHCHESEYKVVYECKNCNKQYESPKEAVECFNHHCHCTREENRQCITTNKNAEMCTHVREQVGSFGSPQEDVEMREMCQILDQVCTVGLCFVLLYMITRL